ncbi:hypothetical protein KH5H1_73070 [Corallococcus caeni]|uniref:hypothetical protein n=1 Tax=Corallococcus caeni TaxID=3082388 RepID=UPI002956EF44|nr:hypothetical protein KH5H1_73070 [Corallococcus sp. KH5-1]
MNVLMINHHLFQEGDTYGLIYALQLSKALRVESPDYSKVYGLLYFNGEEFQSDTDYREKILRRLGYFSSFNLLDDRLKVVACFYSDSTPTLQIETRPFAFSVRLQVPCVHVTANKALFKSNPRLIALALTGAENDPSKAVKTLTRTLLEHEGLQPETSNSRLTAGPFSQRLNEELLRLVQGDEENRAERIDGVSYAYISKSTDYIVDCIRKKSFLAVASTLRQLVEHSTQEYEEANKAFLDEFMEGLVGKYVTDKRQEPRYAWQKFTSAEDKTGFLIILFWIRGAKQDEKAAIFMEGEGSVGKPQHHTNLTLYKYIRNLTQILGQELDRPFLFVPIGDELKELTREGETFGYTKGGKAHNLINFFKREPFAGRPMGAQMNFLLQLSKEFQVIQVGMRSGSMERLMYLGVPTIYFDRAGAVQGLAPPVGAERIKQLCGFKSGGPTKLMEYFDTCAQNLGKDAEAIEASGSSGFPLFFQVENKDTGFLRYSDIGPTWVAPEGGWTRDKHTGKWEQASWVRVPGTRLDNTIRGLLGVLNKGLKTDITLHEFNVFKAKLTQKNYLRQNLEASKKFLMLGGLNEAEEAKFSAMLWFMSVVYPRYSALFGEARTTRATLTLVDGMSRQAKTFSDFKKAQEEERNRKSLARAAKKGSGGPPLSSNSNDENK